MKGIIADISFMKEDICEKPLTHNIWEVRQVQQVAHETGLATQMGNGGRTFITAWWKENRLGCQANESERIARGGCFYPGTCAERLGIGMIGWYRAFIYQNLNGLVPLI